MIRIQPFTFNPFQENTYVLSDETLSCIIIDPGCYEKYEEEELTYYITTNNLKVTGLYNTHCHIDHVLGNAFVKDYFKVPLYIHQIEEPYLRAVKTYAPNYGFVRYSEASHDHYLDENDIISFGNSSLKIMFVPGHSAGHLAFYNEKEKICIAGDVLFNGSIGRTDLPGGDYDTLIQSIQTKLFTLPNDMVVFPGHGPDTTILKEKQSNPFCAIL